MANQTDQFSASFGMNAPGRLEGLLGAERGADDLRCPITGRPLGTTDACHNHCTIISSNNSSVI